MKILSLLLITILFGKGCDSEQHQDLATAIIEYSANTRGFYQKITIKDQTVFITRDRDEKAIPTQVKISNTDWKELITAFQKVDLEQLPNLKAPTEKRFYDGAAIAELKVTYKEKVYSSSSFDHGFPPAEIEKLVNKINTFVPIE